MTDLLAALQAVEEAAEKARYYVRWLGSEQGVVLPEKQCAEVTEILRTLTDLPFRAVREELERLGRIESAARWLAHVSFPTSPPNPRSWTQEEIDLHAVLCPDPAGGDTETEER